MKDKEMKRFYKICRKNEMSLKRYLRKELVRYGYNPVNEKGFLYAKGTLPVLLTAHMDTVHVKTCNTIYSTSDNNTTIIKSPEGIGGDDRCGIYIILRILRETDLRPSILFCEQEEVGGIGSDLFIDTDYINDLKKLKFLVELDRANKDDAVFYDCGNIDFIDFILEETGYIENYGSFSDISNLSPACDIASVNLSCGYYKAHTLNEYVVWEEMILTTKIVEKLLEKAKEDKVPQFDFQEIKYNSWKTTGSYSAYNVFGYDNDSYSKFNRITTEGTITEFHFYYEGSYKTEFINGVTYYDCLGQLMEAYPKLTYNDVLDWYDY